MRVLGKETIPGVNQINALGLGQIDDALNVEVGCNRTFTFANKIGFISFETVDAKTVLIGLNGDCAAVELSGGAENADGNHTPVGGA